MSSEKFPPKEKEDEANLELKIGQSIDGEMISVPLARSPQDELVAGCTFQGKYEILKKLGSGGMGVVYQARDRTFNRLVVIKILSLLASADQKCKLRFQQEARAAGSLSDRGIVAVHEFAISEQGQPFLVMDFVDGTALSDIIANTGNLPLDKCLDITMKLADALDYAHGQGVVHRDLKPANIMIEKDDRGREQIKIVDFGIAKIATEGMNLTETGEVFGSPLYMSPEQCSGFKVDKRTDVYSLACVLYEMLTGRPPHMGETALATALMHVQEQPMPLSAVKPNLQFPHALQVILDKAMAKEPSERYQTMEEFCSNLRKLQEGKSDDLAEISASSNRQRIINAIKQRLAILSGIVCIVSAAFVNNLAIQGFLYLGGGLLLVFSIPGLRGDGPVSVALKRQSRTTIPIGRTELIVWIALVPLLIGLGYWLLQPK